jgi:hypothetical protein
MTVSAEMNSKQTNCSVGINTRYVRPTRSAQAKRVLSTMPCEKPNAGAMHTHTSTANTRYFPLLIDLSFHYT